MSTQTQYGSPDFRLSSEKLISRMETASMGAMAETTTELREELRDQVTAAGLGSRLANAWRSKVYPGAGQRSMNAAGIVYAGRGSAADIFRFNSAQTIVRPLIGQALAIPSEDVPRSRQGKPMSVAEVTARYGRRLQFIPAGDKGFQTPSVRRGTIGFLVLKGLVVRKASQRYRNPSKREIARGKPTQDIIFFTLIRQVRGRALLKPDESFRRWSAKYPALLARYFELTGE